MNLEAFAASDVGLRRDNNEDRYLVDLSLKLLAVSDGMGGHAAGEVAAQRSLEIAARHLRERGPMVKLARASPEGYFRALQIAEDAVEEASRQIYQEASHNHELAGMGATLTLLMIVDDKGIMVHVGDSRLYLVRDGTLHLLSSDHTMANELQHAGTLTREEAEASRFANVLTRAIGTQEATPVESLLFDLLPGDVCLVCSDGLSNYFHNDNEVSALLTGEDLDDTPQQLVELAKSRGGADNITAVVARLSGTPGETSMSGAEVKRCLNAMRSMFLFRGLSLNRLIRAMNIARIDDYLAEQKVIAQGDPCDGIYVVLSGEFACTGESTHPQRFVTGQSFGADSLLLTKKSSSTIVATRASQVLFISGRDFDRLTRRQPKLGRRLLRRLGQHLSERLATHGSAE